MHLGLLYHEEEAVVIDGNSFQRGSIYLITLITVTSIVSMVLIGVSLRSAGNAKSAMIEEMARGSNGVLDASEYALEVIKSDPLWKLTAQSGKVFEEMSVGDQVYWGKVVDEHTGAKPTYDTSTYQVTVTSERNAVKSSASIELFATEMDYVNYLMLFGAVHYWALDETSNPTQALDQIGSYHGNYLYPEVAGAGYNDEAGLVPIFDDDSDHVVVPWGPSFNIENGTIAMWVNFTGSKWSNYSFLGMDYRFGGVPAINMAIWGYGVNIYLNDSGEYRPYSALSTPIDTITPNTWHHIAISWGNMGLFIYVDGVEMASNSSNTDELKTAQAGEGGEQPLHIGGGYNMAWIGTPENGFEGSVSHLAIFNEQLNAVNVADLASVKPDKLIFSIVEDSWARVFE